MARPSYSAAGGQALPSKSKPRNLAVLRTWLAIRAQGKSTILERVRGLIERLTPQPICDECVAEKLDLPWTAQTNQAARELAGVDGFERRSDICAICGRPRVVVAR